MAPWIRRLHLLELNDQAWVPSAVRSRVQTSLTLFWTLKLPLIQASSPAALVSSTLRALLGRHIATYTFIDFCAGAGGPTATIERELNRLLLLAGNDDDDAHPTRTTAAVDFVLTDLHPHRAAWACAAQRSAHVHYVARPVDARAAGAGAHVLDGVTVSPRAAPGARDRLRQRGTFRLFALAFHHMPDAAARAILADALECSDGFGIFELQGRSLGEFVLILLIWPLLLLVAPFYFYTDPIMLFLVYIVPLVPFILVFDGLVSCLRTRTSEEIHTLIRECGSDPKGWRLRHGRTVHTWPLGYLRWYVGVRES